MQKISTGKFHFEPPFTSLDHLVGELLEVQGHVEAKRSSRLQIDDELKFGRLQDRQVPGLRAFKNLTGVTIFDRELPGNFAKARAVLKPAMLREWSLASPSRPPG